MTRRLVAFVALAVILAAVFVRLGFWQLDRRDERRARNAALASQLGLPAVPLAQLPESASYRRAEVRGAADYERELLLTGRSRSGSPGVYVVTPVRRAGSDTAVLVVRGWVYAPDAATIEQPRWRETRERWSGYVNPMPATAINPPVSGARKLRELSEAAVRPLFPYPVDRRYLVAHDSAGPENPARLGAPALDDGPHLSYAIQWFAFAAIALVGAGVVVRRDASARGRGATAA